jgi:hypothetical protein
MYGDVQHLATLMGSEVKIDLLTGTSTANGRELSPRLELADAAAGWIGERLERDGVPDGTVTAATLTLIPRHDDRGSLVVHCAAILTTLSAAYDSHDTVRWHPSDLNDR